MIEDLVAVQRARAIQAIIESAGQRPDSGFFATAVGMILLLLGAGGVVEQLQQSLNTIWRVAPKTGRGIRGLLLDRLLSFSMVLSVGFLLLVLWVYYSSLMFFFGAELTQVYATRYGSKVTSAENAQIPRPAREHRPYLAVKLCVVDSAAHRLK